MSPLEIIAFIVSVLGVWLTARRSVWNFPFSIASVMLYATVFYEVKLYADAILQGIFAATLSYGWVQWLRARDERGVVPVGRATMSDLAVGATLGAATAVAIGSLLSRFTDAALPWIDSSLLAASLVATFWAARRKIESWWIWVAVDVVYVGVYCFKSLYLTAALYALFVVLAFWGLRLWSQGLRSQAAQGSAQAAA